MGYNYSHSTNKAVDITLGWYHYDGSFYWTQYHSKLGYSKPGRVRIGKYINGSGVSCIRIELANNGVYWSHYNIGAMDRSGFPDYYSGWTYNVGEMPVGTTEITNVPLQADVAIQGKLSIGQTAVPDNYQLAVKGKIIAGELKIQNVGNWPDYVFDSSYQLMSLPETDQYIKTNKHLPDMPSAREVEAKGIAVGANQALLLKKVEELTLHLIQLEKKVAQQNEQIQQQQQLLSQYLRPGKPKAMK
ncbi:hypothetical protein ACTJIJ_22270 [Niabella sp. 22666]|uniref:hypothetical protein n=1 Tax=Niabella sp. 22666 TaxID=3453954 RepID=UPI003F8792CF